MSSLFGRKHFQSRRSTLRTTGTLMGTGALLALAGCGGGGSSNNNNNNNDNASLTSANLVALTSDNRLVNFNSRTPGTSSTSTISGLTSGDSLRAIDFRFAFGVAGNGQTGLYGIAQNGTSQQLYSLSTSGTTATATRVGARFNLLPATPAATAFGFDFNPTVDRIRLIEPTANRDLRLNPNADTNTSPVVDGDADASNGTQGDGALTYAAGDANAGQNPDAVSAGYTNSDADASTLTTLFVLDANRNTLATQGRAANTTTGTAAVGPNTGQLFTVANLSLDVSQDSGFDILSAGNVGFISNGNRIYSISLTSGAVTGGARVSAPGSSRIIGLALTQ